MLDLGPTSIVQVSLDIRPEFRPKSESFALPRVIDRTCAHREKATTLTGAWGRNPYLLGMIHPTSQVGPRKGSTWTSLQHSKRRLLPGKTTATQKISIKGQLNIFSL